MARRDSHSPNPHAHADHHNQYPTTHALQGAREDPHGLRPRPRWRSTRPTQGMRYRKYHSQLQRFFYTTVAHQRVEHASKNQFIRFQNAMLHHLNPKVAASADLLDSAASTNEHSVSVHRPGEHGLPVTDNDGLEAARLADKR